MDLKDAIENAVAADDLLVAAIHAEHKAGTSANDIAREVGHLRGYSRTLVLQLLNAEGVRERILAALADAEWKEGDVKVWRDRQRRVRVTLPADAYSNRIERMNGVSALVHTLLGVGLRLVSDEIGDAPALLVAGRPCYVVPQ